MNWEFIIMRTFKPRAFSVSDFYEWYNQKLLVLNPKFQRRAVWAPQAKSYLINTILLGLPLPTFFIRTNTDPDSKKTIREVVDGQQRLRAIIDFINNGYPIRKAQNDEFGGLLFSELPDEIQENIRNYELTVNVLVNLDDKDVLDIFARLNSYGVKLNNQELLNAKYFGYFKQSSYELGLMLSTFWENSDIFTSANILRMREVEFVSELLVGMIDGIQDLTALERYYAKYDDIFEDRKEYERLFIETIDYIANIFEGNLSSMIFHQSPLFYSLFIIIFHMNHGVPGFAHPRKQLFVDDIPRVRTILDEIESAYLSNSNDADTRSFILACKKSTTHRKNKIIRCEYIMKHFENAFRLY